ncbi:MAG: hypothetical protein JRJ09_06195 [Deltaproteobacteria bacterium]|nr:hypothetical protein [Deltaproteobacteria bacterium]MBW2048107.1 hypothetical protein [Deltaproteobacteria bacterium]MBW2111981.1 hypothetical protein [Deltaproteobacteria bacterium]MBW2353238.1 hypothetical protein [Deltaproteobacteria bacterium]HDZ90272.1 hypothetical protein [Deltaproteobacteria bacterium]
MGEIRSTLDIIMEKAGQVKVTDEEKAAFLRNEVEAKVRGLLQKYMDGQIKQERLREEILAMEGERLSVANAALKGECLSMIEPAGDNRPVMEVLEQILDLDTGPVEEILSRYMQDREEKQTQWEMRIKEGLKGLGISGTAVVPNLRADTGWIGYLKEARTRMRRELASLYDGPGLPE